MCYYTVLYIRTLCIITQYNNIITIAVSSIIIVLITSYQYWKLSVLIIYPFRYIFSWSRMKKYFQLFPEVPSAKISNVLHRKSRFYKFWSTNEPPAKIWKVLNTFLVLHYFWIKITPDVVTIVGASTVLIRFTVLYKNTWNKVLDMGYDF